jgi:hypothetical protein
MLFDAAQFMYCIGSASMAGEVFVGREPCMSRTRILKLAQVVHTNGNHFIFAHIYSVR